jgi:hypothetical protein
MSSNENSIIIEYINFYKKYKEIYGKNVVILLEVGSFYEIYNHMSDPSEDLFNELYNSSLYKLFENLTKKKRRM